MLLLLMSVRTLGYLGILCISLWFTLSRPVRYWRNINWFVRCKDASIKQQETNMPTSLYSKRHSDGKNANLPMVSSGQQWSASSTSISEELQAWWMIWRAMQSLTGLAGQGSLITTCNSDDTDGLPPEIWHNLGRRHTHEELNIPFTHWALQPKGKTTETSANHTPSLRAISAVYGAVRLCHRDVILSTVATSHDWPIAYIFSSGN
jgi:hypothetical protein